MIGAFAPYLSTMSKNRGYHILVGCSALVLLSLPMSFFIKETFVPAKEDSDSDDGMNGSFETMARGTSKTRDEIVFSNKLAESDDFSES